MSYETLDEILRAVYDPDTNALKVSPSSSWVPSAADTYSLGSADAEWKSLFLGDDDGVFIGLDQDSVFYHKTAVLNANTALTGVLIGTPVTPALAANSMIISNITADGDVIILGNDGGHSRVALFFDASAPDTILYNVGGTWSAGATAWTIPAVTWGGAVNANSQATTNLNMDSGTIDGATITSPALNGTVTTTGLTLPAVTLGGVVAAGGNGITNIGGITVAGGNLIANTVDNSYLIFAGGSGVAGKGSYMGFYGVGVGGAEGQITIITPDAAGTGDTLRVLISGKVATAVATWSAITQTGLDITSTSDLKFNGTKVIGAQGAAVADATDAASVILRLNELLARTRAHGLIST